MESKKRLEGYYIVSSAVMLQIVVLSILNIVFNYMANLDLLYVMCLNSPFSAIDYGYYYDSGVLGIVLAVVMIIGYLLLALGARKNVKCIKIGAWIYIFDTFITLLLYEFDLIFLIIYFILHACQLYLLFGFSHKIKKLKDELNTGVEIID